MHYFLASAKCNKLKALRLHCPEACNRNKQHVRLQCTIFIAVTESAAFRHLVQFLFVLSSSCSLTYVLTMVHSHNCDLVFLVFAWCRSQLVFLCLNKLNKVKLQVISTSQFSILCRQTKLPESSDNLEDLKPNTLSTSVRERLFNDMIKFLLKNSALKKLFSCSK